MRTAADLLKPALAHRRLSRRKLAERTGSSAASLSDTFHGKQDMTVGRLSKLLKELDYSLVAIPTRVPTVADAAVEVQEYLARAQRANAYRVVLQLAEDLRWVEPATRVALALTPPPTTGDAGFDALIAGVTELELSVDELPLPEWLQTRVPLAEPWDVETVPGLRAAARAVTPEPLAARGVYLDPTDLINV